MAALFSKEYFDELLNKFGGNPELTDLWSTRYGQRTEREGFTNWGSFETIWGCVGHGEGTPVRDVL